MQYELFYLIASSKEAQLDKIKQEVSDLVKSEGGVFEEKQVIEKRKMAYEIKHENRGLYVAQRFNLENPEQMSAITRKLNLYTEILRFVVTRTDELPELTSRQEREAKAQTKAQTKVEPRAEVKKVVRPEVATKAAATTPATEPAAPAEEAAAPAPKEKPMNEEDIDKKLEEILNI
ncbi:MAG: 30S ribosomal protein S6 [Parcubacteria group bacterium]|jgi:small subunit ribosomal protein S6